MAQLATLDDFEVLRPVGHGPEGFRYLGRDADENEVEIIRLGRLSRERRLELERRIDLLLDIAAPGVRRVVRASLEGATPYVVVERMRPLADVGYDCAAATAIISAIAHAIAEAHRVGMVHGILDRHHVGIGRDEAPRVDFTGIAASDRTGLVSPPPELAREQIPTTAGDVWSLGVLYESLIAHETRAARGDDATEADHDRRARELIGEMKALDPDRRPSAREVADRLLEAAVVTDVTAEIGAKMAAGGDAEVVVGQTLGRFELLEAIGEGGMGRVFRGRDVASGDEVAIKVLSSRRRIDDLAVRRFRREARLLSRVDSPGIARFVEANEDRGVLYLAMELVEGRSLKDAMDAGQMPSSRALDIGIEVCRALADIHDLGVVHRDVKPANILLSHSPDVTGPEVVKLCDFGIARPLDPAEDSGITRAGAAPGTPWYMSPEQCRAQTVGVQADVYALGATLFHVLTGEPPFPSREAAVVVAGHLNDPPPDLRALRPDVDERVAAVIARALEKDPDNRYADGREMLRDLESARHGERADIEAHPLPSDAGNEPSVYRFQWRLASSPEELWPYVSDTERFNRAVGLASVQFSHQPTDDGVETNARQQVLGMVMEWREHPFEWVAPRRLGVLREHSRGPFAWIRNTVDLTPQRGGTLLTHTVEAAPRGVVGRATASLEIGVRLRRSFARVYQRIDETCVLARAAQAAMGRVRIGDPYEEPPELSLLVHRRIDDAQDRLLQRGNPPEVVEALVDHLREAPPQEVAHIRPVALARRVGVDEDAMIRTCLWAAQGGALELLWDIICPACRIPSSIVETMGQLREHAHCDACDLDFELDLARSVELVFRAHPSIRQSDQATYCIGGPAHSPHVLAQVRLSPGERFVLDPELGEGAYRLTGRWSDRSFDFRVARQAPHGEWHLKLRQGLSSAESRSLRPGKVRICLENDDDREAVIRLERSDGRSEAFTASHAASHPLFRELFPSEVLSPDQLVGVSHIAVVLAETSNPGRLYREGRDGRVFRELIELREMVEHQAAVEGGTLVKLMGDGVLAVFTDNTAALKAALALHRQSADARIIAHAGAAMMTTIDGRLDYFGRLVFESQFFGANVEPGELLVSEALISDSQAAELFAGEAPRSRVFVKEGLLANRVATGRAEVA